MDAADMRPCDAGGRGDGLTWKVWFGRNGCASEELLVEVGQRPPIFGDDIRVSIFRDQPVHGLAISAAPVWRLACAWPLAPWFSSPSASALACGCGRRW